MTSRRASATRRRSLAAHQNLGNLIVLYDDNSISIEDDTNIAKSEDVAARYEAYGWHVQRVSWRTAEGYHEDVATLAAAFENARNNTVQPSLIALRTIIGWPAPNAQNTGEAHGAALGAEEVAKTKRILHFDPEVNFPAEDEALGARAQGRRARQEAARRVGGVLRGLAGEATRTARRCSTGCPRGACPRAGPRCSPSSRRTPRARRRAGPPAPF